MASSSLAQGFGSLATQQQAKSISQQHLNSNAGGKPTVYSNDVTAIKDLASFMSNQTNTRQDQVYQRQLQDSRDWAERSAQVAEGTQRRNLTAQQNIAAIQGAAQISSATASAAPGMYNAQSSRVGAIGQLSKAGGAEMAKSLLDPYYKPNTQKIDEEAFNEKARDSADQLFGRGAYADGKTPYGTGGYSVSSGYGSDSSKSLANAAGDIARDKAQTENQAYLSGLNQRNQIDMMNRQTSINAQEKANDYLRQSRESAAERASRERGQAMDAQSKVYSSMFGAFSGGGNQNYQYWGGKV